MESRFLRFLVSIVKLTHDANRNSYRFVPYCDVINQFTNWQKIKNESEKRDALDHELMDYFGLSKEDQDYIFKTVNRMNASVEDILESNLSDDE
ncbi:hypothetical protein [Mycoplasmoides alvi]|uniref:hypothetical protein n=1 Tax=Mycoplasmoides alvi TaxID=78580 RepID=UPI00051ACDDA|nr:hypothetical protein [Mycoplasmoides alvi]